MFFRRFSSSAAVLKRERSRLLSGDKKNVALSPPVLVRGSPVTIVDSVETARRVVNVLNSLPLSRVVAWNIEATEVDMKRFHTAGTGGRVLCASCAAEGADFGNESSTVFIDALQSGQVLSEFKKYFEDSKRLKCSHSSADDFHVLIQQGIAFRGIEADTRCLSRLANTSLGSWEGSASGTESKGYDLRACAGNFDCGEVEPEDKKKEKFIAKLNGSKIAHFSPTMRPYWIKRTVENACITLDLFEKLKHKLQYTEWTSQVLGNSRREENDENLLNMYDLARMVHKPLLEVLAEVERTGMALDLKFLESIRKETLKIVEKYEKQFQSVCAEMRDPSDPTRFLNPDADLINVHSPQHVRQLLFGYPCEDNLEWFTYGKDLQTIPNRQEFQVPASSVAISISGIGLRAIKSKMNKKRLSDYSNKGLPSVNQKLLVEYAGKDPERNIFGRAMDSDQLGKFGSLYAQQGCLMLHSLVNITKYQYVLSSFIEPLIEKAVSGRIHPSLSLDTSTGRLACKKPNLHNPPNASDTLGVRAAFICGSEKHCLIVADYSQLELRILAHVTNCKSMIESLNAGGDYHSRTAMDMFPHVRDCPVDEIKHKYPAERSKAKAVNFSIAYGKCARSIAEDMDCDLKEAADLLSRWYESKPEVAEWKAETVFKAKVKKQVESILGRTRDIPHIDNKLWKGRSERAAVNHCIQGSAADIAICAMVQIGKSEQLKKLGFKLLMQIHDEFIIEGPSQNATEAKAILVDLMQNPFRSLNPLYQFKVPLEVDAGVGPNWLVAKP